MKDLAFISEKIVNGIVYRAFRSTVNPRDTYVERDGKMEKVDNLKAYWAKL
jgi:hypothetical protein